MAAALHVAALVLLVATEVDPLGQTIFLAVWGLLNFFWLALLRRPLAATLLSVSVVVPLILLSRFKHDKLWATLDFVDLMILDQDTVAFLLAAMPSLLSQIVVAAGIAAVLLVTVWRLDPFRIRRRISVAAGGLCLGAIVALSLSFPTDLTEDFVSRNYVSKFARTGVEAIREYSAHGYLDADAGTTDELTALPSAACAPTVRLPHIILLHDESSFDIRAASAIRVPPGYGAHFRSFDGAARKLVVEGAGGPSWFTEFNVLTGLSVRSFGRFATSATRISAGRIGRGLPQALRHCGYKTFTLYPFYGAFLGSRAFQTTTGIEHYLDMRELGTRGFEADGFYFDQAEKILARWRGDGPLFLYVYTVANHFPWDTVLRPEATPGWRAPGNGAEVDEYIRRQMMTADAYTAWRERLRRNFPDDSFLIVRYGDHLPEFGARVIDPTLGAEALSQHLQQLDPRYLTTYYAVDAVNFAPADVSSALDTLDAPYLPIVVQEAAGVPLDASFVAQRKILARCRGVFFRCAGGSETRHFNRLLIAAGLINNL